MGTPSGGLSLDSLPSSPTLSDRLRLAASQGQLDSVQALLRDGASFDIDRDGRTALHYAALNGYTDVTRFLLQKGCPVDTQDASGYTALHRATSQGHLDVITLLVETGCDVNTQDEHGNAALHEAAWNGYSRTMELLVKHDVNIAITNKAGFSALHLATQNGHNESTRVLLYAGCNTDHKNNYGDTALHTAARYGHAGVTRILISARTKLLEQNKNGDTALHIAAALKRRKIAKLLVESGMDTQVRNKQSETAADVAMRKEHTEIVSIIQAFTKTKLNRLRLKEVNFKEELHVIDGPVVVPDQQLPGKPDTKPEKNKKFFFFKKKKSKEKEKVGQKGGVSQQKAAPTDPRVHIGHTPVQGLFSKYVPRQGVQYYRDLAGNVKQGPVGYSPTCHCGPAVSRLQKNVNDTRQDVYGRIQTSNRAMQEQLAHVDRKSVIRVDALEQYTRQRFQEEGALCQQRINTRMEGEQRRPQPDTVRLQIQDWLEQKLEGYGHCLEHHHDDSAIPNDNIFTNIHETADGRIFKSRSDETLSQSDNHSGHFRKRDFYESRQEAMQQIRAWQMPNYSRDRNKVKVTSDQNRRPSNTGVQQRMRNVQNRPQQSVQSSSQHIPIEARVEIRNKNSAKLLDSRSPATLPTHNSPYSPSSGDSNYMTMSGYQTQGAAPKPLPHSPSWPGGQYQQVTAPGDSRTRHSGPVTHSTPKHMESSPANIMVNSHTDSGISQSGKTGTSSRQQILSDKDSDYEVMTNQNLVSHKPPVLTRTSILSSKRTSQSSPNLDKSPISGEFRSGLPTPSSPALGISQPGDGFRPSLPKPTFTTFGYDDVQTGHTAPANSPEQVAVGSSVYRSHSDILEATACSTPRSNNETNSSNISDKHETDVPKFPAYRPYSRQESQSSYGFVPTSKENFFKSANQNNAIQTTGLRQRTQSIEGLLTGNSDHVDSFDRSKSEERSVELQAPGSPRSSSESRGSFSTLSCSPSKWQQQTSYTSSPTRSYSQTTHPQASSTPRRSLMDNVPQSGSAGNPASRGVYNPAGATREVERGNVLQCKPVSNKQQDSGINCKLENMCSNDDKNSPRENSYSVISRCSKPEHPYSTVREVKGQKDDNDNYPEQTNSRNVYYFHDRTSNIIGAKTVGQAEPTRMSYQTYLTGCEPQPVKGTGLQRENSPNICNVSKEDSGSNPDSGYSSKIYGNRAGSVPPPSNSGTPTSSFSTDRGLSTPSHTNSPHSQYSNTDYEALPAIRGSQAAHEVETQVQSWYQRKLQETTQRIYDNWRSENSSPGKRRDNGGQNIPPASYSSDGYGRAEQPNHSQPQTLYPMSSHYGSQSAYSGFNYQHSSGNSNPPLVSSFGSDV